MKVISELTPEKWDQMVEKCPAGTFFHTYTWANILHDSYGFEIATRLFAFDDGTEALLPLMKTAGRFGILRGCYSMPFGTYGGILSPAEDVSPYIQDIFTYLRKQCNEISIYPAPHSRVPYSLAPFKKSATYTHILNLENGFDFIWKNLFNDKCRNQVRKAEKSGVSVVVDNSEDAFRAYYEIYLQTVERWSKASTIYPWDLFKAMASAKSEKVRLWLAMMAGKAIAGTICFYGNRNLFYWSSAMLKEFSKECPNYALQNEIIKDACQNGYLTYNMGGSGDLEGVRTFKENFGAKKFEYNIFSYQSSLAKLYGRLAQFKRTITSYDRA